MNRGCLPKPRVEPCATRLRWFVLDGHTEMRSNRLTNSRPSSTSAVASHRLWITSFASPDESVYSPALPALPPRLQRWRWDSRSPPVATSWWVAARCAVVLRLGARRQRRDLHSVREADRLHRLWVPGAGRFGELLRQYRTAAGLTQVELADRAGLSERRVQDLERGLRRVPHPDTARRLSVALGLVGHDRTTFEGTARPAATPARDWLIQTARRSNPPRSLNSFVGRARELAEVHRLLGTTRLLTLTGTGGIGKTRLAQQAAADLLQAYPDGVWWVEFSRLADQGLVPQVVATALGVVEQQGRPLVQTLADYLHRRTLLVLDNCEHLIQPCADLSEGLLRACPKLHPGNQSRTARCAW
jgi:transcriptional regulator with XRE-family HTH domain